MSDELKDLISKVIIFMSITIISIQLLDRDPWRRLGYKEDVNEIINHPFFKEVDFDKL